MRNICKFSCCMTHSYLISRNVSIWVLNVILLTFNKFRLKRIQPLKQKFNANLFDYLHARCLSRNVKHSIFCIEFIFKFFFLVKKIEITKWHERIVSNIIELHQVEMVIKCCECFATWLFGASRRKGVSRCPNTVLASPLPLSSKSSNESDYNR